MTRNNEQAHLATAEAVFRHAVGEIDESERAERLREPERVQAACAEQLAVLATQRARFAEALPGFDLQAWGASTSEPKSAVAADPETMRLADKVIASAKAAERPSQQTDRPANDMTMILPDAVLIGIDPPFARFRLAVVNYVGRGEDNQVRLNSEEVSQRHAVIMATASGFVVKDLQSRNGTFVNGDRIQERTLGDGDRIQIGTLELRFHVSGLSGKRAAS